MQREKVCYDWWRRTLCAKRRLLLAKLGFLGLGIMGYPMARHLVKLRQRSRAVVEHGAKAQRAGQGRQGSSSAPRPEKWPNAPTLSSTASATPPWPAKLPSARTGLIEGVRSGAVIADCSTISPAVSSEIGAAFAAKGAHFLDAPCTGSKPGAENATLTFMIGGDQAVFERAKPYLRDHGQSCSIIAAARAGLAGQADAKSDPGQPVARLRRGDGPGHQGRRRAAN